MFAGCGRPGDFSGDPYKTVGRHVMWICEGDCGVDTLFATWVIHPSLDGYDHKWFLYIDGEMKSRNSPTLISVEIPTGHKPSIAVVAVPPIVDDDEMYNPLCRGARANLTQYNTDLIKPIKADLEVLNNEITLYYRYTYEYYNHIIINGKLVDSNGFNGKEYPVTIQDFDNFGISISIVPLPFIAGPELFEGCKMTDQFRDLICPDILLHNFGYVLFGPPAEDELFGKTKQNYVDYSRNEKGISLKERTKMTIKPRKAIVNGKLVTKPEKKNQVVLRVQDYRFTVQFDKQKFYTIYHRDNFPVHHPCYVYRLPAQPGAINVRLPSGTYASQDLNPRRNAP